MSTRAEQLLFLAGGLANRLQEAQEEDIQGVVQVLRCLSGKNVRVRTDPLLASLVAVLAVPLAERGLALSFRHSSRERPARVDGGLVCETVTGALMAIADGVPAGYSGSVVVDLCAQGAENVEIVVELLAGSGQLPFEVDLLSVQQALQKAIKPAGGLAVLMGRKLSLHLPVVPG